MGFKLTVLVTFIAASPILAQLAFDPPVNLSTGAMPRCVRGGDLDGDGDNDLVVVAEGSNDVRVFKNDGTGGFALTSTLTGGLGASWVAIAPIDTDTDLDLVVTFRDSNFIGVYFNNGMGGFAPGVPYTMPGGPVSAVAEDLDNDSWPDLAITNEVAGVVSVLLNNGTGTFGPRVDTVTGNWPVSVAAGDFTADGFLDLAVSHLIGGTVAVLHNAGTSSPGTFSVTSSLTVGAAPFGIVTANLDATAGLDLAVASFNANTVVLFSGSGAGTFSPSTTIPVGFGPSSLVSFDFDGDLLADLAVAEYVGTVSVLLRSSPATFAAPVAFPAGPGSINVGAADLDGDSDLELLSANHQGSSASVIFRTLLGANGFGNVGIGAGGPFNHLFINGSSGGRDRRVNVGINQLFTFSVTQPPSNPNPVEFVLFGQLGIPNPLVDANVLPFGIGTSCIRFCVLFPAAIDLFFLANSYGVPICGPPILPSAAGPWTSVAVSVGFAVTATLQGVILETPSTIRVTNGIVLAIN